MKVLIEFEEGDFPDAKRILSENKQRRFWSVKLLSPILKVLVKNAVKNIIHDPQDGSLPMPMPQSIHMEAQFNLTGMVTEYKYYETMTDAALDSFGIEPK